ncbi:DUF914-domain-containing protein [Nadsonia fulvescens var. elongata DSM 6958]|uniref:DUF914-domain-containing protein n=1 Tax=Nadsonia fulvescens var. elongata DSM 6958 TaxID=857566 RepID=A0A1E3PHT5_9ASCO|nr:DUF914-domain-containing protein [Nadsonia fulvescens var. elongata DSM 6958]
MLFPTVNYGAVSSLGSHDSNGNGGSCGCKLHPEAITRARVSCKNDKFDTKWWKLFAIFVHGQILSLCIVGTHIFSTLLADSGYSMPALQSFFNYSSLFLIFTPVTIFRLGLKRFFQMLVTDGYKFFFLALGDVLGNYFVVKAYTYTNLLSVELLDMWGILTVVLISMIFFKTRYNRCQFAGIGVCFLGLLVVLLNDMNAMEPNHSTTNGTYVNTETLWSVSENIKGDLFVILGATLYGISNTLEESFVSKKPINLVLGQMGFWGMVISGVQSYVIYFVIPATENINVFSINRAINNVDAKTVGYFSGFTLVMLILYTTTPVLFRNSSATYYNMSILTSDFWGLLVGAKLFRFKLYWLYPFGFLLTILGMVIYYLGPETLEHGHSKPGLTEETGRC